MNDPAQQSTTLSPTNSVVIFVEGLGTQLVGAYGANTALTPSIDRLAARGLILDQCYLDSTSLETQLASLWTGRHAMQPGNASTAQWTIWSQLRQSQVDACLLTDCPQVAAHAEHMGCDEVVFLEPELNTSPCTDNAECGLSGLFAAAAEELAGGRRGLLWIHSKGLKLPWDAPLELRSRFVDPEDPDPPTEIGPPKFEVAGDTDPDLVTGWGQVAAAQAAVVDQAIAALMKVVATREDHASYAWMLGSLGGVSLGENQYVGFGNPIPHTEQLRALAILYPAEFEPVGKRRAELFQLPDLCLCLLEMLGQRPAENAQSWGRSCLRSQVVGSPDQWPTGNQLAVLATEAWQWVRCPAWSAIVESGQTVRLFVKPDDRWEVTDVANRRASVCQRMEQCLEEFRQAARDDRRGSWPALADELTNLLR